MRTIALPFIALCVASLSGLGCSADADVDGMAESSEDALRALTTAEIVGTLAEGETKTVAVSAQPTYRALKMTLTAGQKVDLWVKSENGDPQAWLLGAKFQTLGRSVDESPSDNSAHFKQTVTKDGTYYVAFRDEKFRSATFTVSLGAAAPPPPPSSSCSSDAQCGGGSAMCFIDRCVTVKDETKTSADSLTDGIVAAYTQSSELRVAYRTWRSGGIYTMVNDLWSSGLVGSSGSSLADARFLLDHGPKLEPVLATSYDHYNGGGVSYGGWGGVSVGYHESVRSYAVGRNQAETLFVVVAKNTPAAVNSTSGDKCTLLFASRPKFGTWSALEHVDTCGWSNFHNLAIHVRADGGADIVSAAEHGSVVVYRRQNPIDPWAKSTLVASSDRSTFAFAHGVDGHSHLVAQPYTFTTDSSRGDYTGTYVELGDNGAIRTIPLSTHRTQWRRPFLDLAEDGDGNVWIQKRPSESSDRPSLVRVSKSGQIAERSVGLVSAGSWPSSSLAVAKSGEISLVHVADNRNISVRRFTPINR